MKRSALKVLLVALLPALLAAASTQVLASRKKHRLDTERSARVKEVESGPRVLTAKVRPSASTRTVTVLAESKPWSTVTLYAKVSGYVRTIPVDKGDAVKSGGLLAIIESPETDRQYDAAREDAKNKRIEAKRSALLLKQGLTSSQDALKAETDAEVAESNVATIAAQKSYEVLRAPFAGTVTARYVDLGALVQNATATQTGAQPVVSLSTLDRLRIQAFIDQHDAAVVKVGDPVTITMDEKPGVTLNATVTRLAGELAPKTKTMLVEIEWNNEHQEIVTGAFVTLSIKASIPSLPEVPIDALVLQRDVASVAVVDAENHVHFRKVKIADNDGSFARIVEGVKIGEVVALYLGESLVEGATVQPVASASASAH
ncbi:MAG: efflux RND transporter periplasmic adaptor subunit [Polyangiales bacterium]